MKLIKVAIIGAGKIAEEHIKAFKALKTTKIVGIFSRTESKAIKLKNKYKISKVYTNIDNMYLGSLPDLVIVAVSILSVREVLKKVSKYEWYCLCEKPIGINYKETLEMCERMDQLRGISPWILYDIQSPRRQLKKYQDGFNRKGLLAVLEN